MSYIYKITNDINNKIYIGKTDHSIDKRWREHLRDYKKDKCKSRPLYSAMNKHGIDHFYIEEIEQCDQNISKERETYWIEYYGSFKNGYNDTHGGDGRKYLDYNLIISVYNKLNNCVKTAEILDISSASVRSVLQKNNIKIKNSGEIATELNGKSVIMKDLNNNIIKIFDTQSEAAKWIQENNKTINHNSQKVSYAIGRVANGKRNTAYGYKWERI